MPDSMPPAVAPAHPAAPRPTFWQRWSRWIGGAAATAGVVFGSIGPYQAIALPGCAATRTVDTLRAIFRDKKVAIDSIGDSKPITDSFSERTSQAVVIAPGEVATIFYRIFRNGFSMKVMNIKLDTKPA